MLDFPQLFVHMLEQLLLLLFAWFGSAGGAILAVSAFLCAVLVPFIVASFHWANVRAIENNRVKWPALSIASNLLLPFLVLFLVFLGVHAAVRDLTYVPELELIQTPASQPQASNQLYGHFLWLSNLGAPDRTFILPALALIVSISLFIPMLRHSAGMLRQSLILVLSVLIMIATIISLTSSSGALLFWVLGSTILLTFLYSFVMSMPQH